MTKSAERQLTVNTQDQLQDQHLLIKYGTTLVLYMYSTWKKDSECTESVQESNVCVKWGVGFPQSMMKSVQLNLCLWCCRIIQHKQLTQLLLREVTANTWAVVMYIVLRSKETENVHPSFYRKWVAEK